MKTICPYCGSTHVQITTQNSFSQAFNFDSTLVTPTLLAALGGSVCKSLKVNPLIGEITGTVVGVVINMVYEANMKKPKLLKGKVYHCLDCEAIF